MTHARPRSVWPGPVVLILCVLAPPLGLLAWVFGNEAERTAYLASWWVRAGLILLAVGSAPLLAVIVAARVGLWPDPDPNPVGPGLLFALAGMLATGALLIGVARVWLRQRRGS